MRSKKETQRKFAKRCTTETWRNEIMFKQDEGVKLQCPVRSRSDPFIFKAFKAFSSCIQV